jgi:ribosomal protein L11 methylase PrmA
VLGPDKAYRYFRRGHTSEFASLLESGLLGRLCGAGQVIESRALTRSEASDLYDLSPDIELVVEHPLIPFISYAYEWPFEMMKDAALLTLNILEESLDSGFMVKDATPFNVQFRGGSPVFIDVASIEPYREGEPWMAYSQFCRTFLNPLLLQSARKLPFQSFLRGSLDGITPEVTNALLPTRKKFRPSIFMDVTMQAWFNQRARSGGKKKPQDETVADKKPTAAKIPKAVISGMVKRLTRTVTGLKRPGGGASVWLDYEEHLPYEQEALDYKDRFVAAALDEAKPRLTWDLGANTGRYSMMAAERSDYVIAIDFDEAAVGAMYERTRGKYKNLLPIVMDFMNPSPNLGWDESERQGLAARGPADFAVCLALVHHLAISGNVPLQRIVNWLAGCARGGVVEFVPKSDPMVQTLLRTREDVFSDYNRETFERHLQERFHIDEAVQIPSSERVLYRFSGT